ncbi:MAG: hypothetical protein DCC67_03795 [Planctomycetota bacterium]|nr:MAG: hypothetical protein DCC67_03795 [Planctomycetota bacterium]
MHRVGIAFKSPLSPQAVFEQYIEPLRTALETVHAGIYSNYLRQVGERDAGETDEHLIVFIVHDFQAALRLLRLELQRIGVPGEATFHNLDPSEPMY